MNEHENSNFPMVSVGAIGAETVQTVNARSLHSFLMVGKKFADWVRERVEQYGFTENVDFVTYSLNGEKGRPTIEYAVSLDMAKELSMVERNDQGKKARQYFIDCERRAKDPVAALNDPAALRHLLLENVNKVIELQARVEADKPKTSFYDSYINADGLYTLQNTGRALNCHPNLFARWLKQKYVFYQGSALVPRVLYIQMGIFEVKSEIVDDKARPRTFVTAKGLEYFASRVPAEIKMKGAA